MEAGQKDKLMENENQIQIEKKKKKKNANNNIDQCQIFQIGEEVHPKQSYAKKKKKKSKTAQNKKDEELKAQNNARYAQGIHK